MVKVVEYRGVVYRRYPGRLYYSPGGSVLGHGGTSLHRQIWLDAGREIPPKWHIHHVNGDHDDNALENLACFAPSVHAAHHCRARMAGELGQRLTAWRQSESGRAILRENAYKMLARTPERQCACPHCGVSFTTRHPQQKFCSDRCKELGNYPIRHPCPVCGALCKVKRASYRQVQTCSYRCGWALRRQKTGV